MQKEGTGSILRVPSTQACLTGRAGVNRSAIHPPNLVPPSLNSHTADTLVALNLEKTAYYRYGALAMSTDFSDDARKLLAFGSANPSAVNLLSQLLVLNSLRIAADIISQLPADRCLRLLDWCAGIGHMSYVLARRGYDVISFDVLQDGARLGDQQLFCLSAAPKTRCPKDGTLTSPE